jgi:hypothetical protein
MPPLAIAVAILVAITLSLADTVTIAVIVTINVPLAFDLAIAIAVTIPSPLPLLLQLLVPEAKSWANLGGYKHMKLLLCAYGQHMNVLKHFVYAYYGCGKQFVADISLNHDVMT